MKPARPGARRGRCRSGPERCPTDGYELTQGAARAAAVRLPLVPR